VRILAQLVDFEMRELIYDAYWMEVHLEFFNDFIGSTHLRNKVYKDVINKIGKDSEQHKIILEKLISKIKFLDLDYIQTDKNRKSYNMDLDKMNEENIMRSLLENEKTAHEYYVKLYNTVDREMLIDSWTGDNVDEFFEDIKLLIEWEERHIDLVEQVLQR
jgi:hypothetical protein